MFRKILIANRGEIACRIMRTARRIGVATVAVYSEADRRALHVQLADEAWPIESYLSIANIMATARRAGAEAIHPGYGFLSENAKFAEACAEAGVAFIGPPAEAILAMGSKAAAKALVQKSGVPLVPGYHEAAQDEARLADAAERIGYPVLIKASAGGGGRGMRVVARAADLAAAIGSAQREAEAAFGDGRLLLEKFLIDPRHIEIQIFADAHGNVVSLFERDCSIQRRYQKIIEEAPAPGMSASLRRTMGEAAIAAARAVGYVGAGTVEFIVSGGEFSFMEMNTRLQVEHAVTEMITRQDLVEWQLRVAAGEPLPLKGADLSARGAAIEARVYAEDPARDFLPSTGTLVHLREPPSGPDVRIDSGIREGDTIGTHYDAMLGKLIVWGEDRTAAVRKLGRALGAYEVVGLSTNLDLLRAIAAHREFAAARTDTGFIARNAPDLMGAGEALAPEAEAAVVAAAAFGRLGAARREAARASAGDPFSPWGLADGWRVNGEGFQDLLLEKNGARIAIRAFPLGGDKFRLELPRRTVVAESIEDGKTRAIRIDGVIQRMSVVPDGEDLVVVRRGRNHRFRAVDPFAPPGGAVSSEQRVIAPIPARVSRIFVKPGDVVAKGAALLVLEAMKMELTLAAPREGTIGEVRCEPGEMVAEGAELVTFDAAGP
ncbi:MAG: acetyl/propionyl/methylcrotonyl-CoA carboxylase subunit alpha [Acetobacteraceae bacterium]